MENKIYIWIDESGTLSKNPKNPNKFIYAGYWCLEKDLHKIESGFSKHLCSFFPSCRGNEKKASCMSNRKKKLLVKGLLERNPTTFHPQFVTVNLDDVTSRLDRPYYIQLQKNYLLRRFVEKCVKNYRSIYDVPVKNVSINIDDQTITNISPYGSDNFPKYLQKYFNGSYNSGNFMSSDAKFETSYKDSKKYRSIQICDILANSKYCHYIHKSMILSDLFNKYYSINLKLPKDFY